MIPLNGHTFWTPSQYDPILPPLVRRMPGRPKKNRIRAVEEKEDGVRRRKRRYTNEALLARDKKDNMKMSRVGRIMICTSCHKEGHNKRTCTNQGNDGTSSSGVRFQGVGVYTNIETGRTVIN
ncbi:hypothetical protein LINPERPRIM_LOCUS2066, partial [Linum perenne]